MSFTPRERILAAVSVALVASFAVAGLSSATARPAPTLEQLDPPTDPRPLPSAGDAVDGGAGAPRPEPVAVADSAALTVPSSPLVVHVSGKVRHPGVYTLPPGSRLQRAIHVAGGFALGAQRDALNLAARLEDSDQIHVPEETRVVGEGHDEPTPSRVATSPSPVSAGKGRVIGKVAAPPGRGVKPAPPAKLRTPGDGTVALNRATAAELQRLPGVGKTTAERILEARRAAGRFASLEALAEVKGIGAKRLERLRPFLVLD